MAVRIQNVLRSPLPHKVGKKTRGSFRSKNRDENFNTYVVGQDNTTGRTIVSDGNGTINLDQNLGNVRPGERATVSRTETKENGRTMTAVVRQFTTGGLLTYTYQVNNPDFVDSDSINDTCDESGGPTFPPSSPPEAPEPEKPPEDFLPPEEEEEEEEDPISVPFGCNPDDSAQWFNGTSCPSGTVSLGFAELPGGQIMTLCQGASTPAGDGCPVEPSTYGFNCEDGNCVEVPNGTYATLEECQGSCSSPSDEDEIPINPNLGWENVDGTCQEIPGGTYGSQAECIAQNEEITLVEVWLHLNRDLCDPAQNETFRYRTARHWTPTLNVTAVLGDVRGDCGDITGEPGKTTYYLDIINLDTGQVVTRYFTWTNFTIEKKEALYSDGTTVFF